MKIACSPLLLLLTPLLAAQQPPAGQLTLTELRDNTRPLLIFAAKANDPQLEIQLRTLQEHAAEAADRQLVPVALPYRAPGTTAVTFSDAEADNARRLFHIPPDRFAVVLIGKDGGLKLRSDKPLSIEKLDRAIDAMPMRQEEIHGK